MNKPELIEYSSIVLEWDQPRFFQDRDELFKEIYDELFYPLKDWSVMFKRMF